MERNRLIGNSEIRDKKQNCALKKSELRKKWGIYHYILFHLIVNFHLRNLSNRLQISVFKKNQLKCNNC